MTVAPAKPAVGAQRAPTPVWVRATRVLGWLLMTAGVVVGLFIVYLLFWTGRETDAIQAEQLTEWEAQAESWTVDQWEFDRAVGDAEGIESLPQSGPVEDAPDPGEVDEVIVDPEPGSAYALVWFERDGTRIVNERMLSVVEGVTLRDLQSGPGHYPASADPGQAGNFSVAGHRTTWSAPFWDLDTLQPGDEIHVVDLEGRHFVYDFRELRSVLPSDVWVLDDDPLGVGGDHWMVMTTCHPRFSAAQRLVAFASLQEVPQ